MFGAPFSDIVLVVEDSVEFDSFIYCRWNFTVTHTAPWAGLEPTHRRVTFHGSSWVRVVGAKFGDAWDFWGSGCAVPAADRVAVTSKQRSFRFRAWRAHGQAPDWDVFAPFVWESRMRPPLTIATLLLLFGFASPANANLITTFTRIVDGVTLVPGGIGTFEDYTGSGFPPIPGHDQGTVVFRGTDSVTGRRGIYVWSRPSGLQPVVDTTTVIPGTQILGGPNTFFGFGGLVGPQVDGNNIAFFGHNQGGSRQGIYRWSSGVVTVIADLDSAAPPGADPGDIDGFRHSPAISGNNVAFGADSTAQQNNSFAARGGGPGPTTLIGLQGNGAELSIEGSTVAFGNTGGVFLGDGLSTIVVADTASPIPNGLDLSRRSQALARSTTELLRSEEKGHRGNKGSTLATARTSAELRIRRGSSDGIGDFFVFDRGPVDRR